MYLQMSRMLAAKTALAIRVDALGETTNAELGLEHRAKLERRVRELEEGKVSVLFEREKKYLFQGHLAVMEPWIIAVT
jgi:RNA processing factor Prp31